MSYDDSGRWVDPPGRDWVTLIVAPLLLVLAPSAVSVAVVLYAGRLV